MKQLIVIPAYNTNQHISILIAKIRLKTDEDILVYDDGSNPSISLDDSFGNIVLKRNTVNKGKGNVLIKAFNYALKNNFTHIITIDSDLQHNPDSINLFLDTDKEVDLVVGKRDFSKPMPIHRRFSNRITSFIISILVRKKIKDSQCGYRKYKISSFNIKSCIEKGFHFESEILLKSMNGKSIIEHIDIETIYNMGNNSSIKNFSDTLKFISLIRRFCFGF